tara:strand:+ start:46 stop:627 length:582 start_codon:yes stop_codon:yes gene_type:complete
MSQVVVDLVDVMHQTEMVETVIYIQHHTLVLVVVLLIVELVEVVTKMVVLQALLLQEVAVVVQLVVDMIPVHLMLVMVEMVIKLHGFLIICQISSVNQDQHQECGTAVVVEVVQDQVQVEDLVEIIQQKLPDMLEVVLVEHPYQTTEHMHHNMLSMHQVVVEAELWVDHLLSTLMEIICCIVAVSVVTEHLVL